MYIRIISSIIAAAFLIVAASTQAGAPVSAEVFNKLRATLEVPITGLKVGTKFSLSMARWSTRQRVATIF